MAHRVCAAGSFRGAWRRSRTGWLACLAIAAAFLSTGASPAQAVPPVTLELKEGIAQWESLVSQGFPAEWGYKVAISNAPRCEGKGCRITEYFEVQRGADPQSYIPYAQNVGFTAPEGKVYVGVGALSARGTSPPAYSEEELVPVAGSKISGADPAPAQLWTEGNSVLWETTGHSEWGYKVAVSNLPRCFTSHCRITESVEVPRGPGPQIYSPCLAKLHFTPIEDRVYVGVGTINGQGGTPASYTGSEVAVAVPECLPPPPPPIHAPTNIVLPAVTGTAIAGHDLTAVAGVWEYQPTSYTYQWQLCDAAGGACANVIGATAPTFPLAGGDVGRRLRVVVAAQNAGGSTPAVSLASALVGSTVEAKVEYSFGWSRAYTIVESLIVVGVPPGAIVEVACRGRGCPFRIAHPTSGVSRMPCRRSHCHAAHRSPPSSQIDATHLFKGRHLRPGAVISVHISKPGWVGQFITYTVRANRRPKRQSGCLAPGSSTMRQAC